MPEEKLWTRTYSTRDQVPVCLVFTRAKSRVPFWDSSKFAVTVMNMNLFCLSPCFECSFCPRRFISLLIYNICLHVSILLFSTCLFPNITYHWANHILKNNIKFWRTKHIYQIKYHLQQNKMDFKLNLPNFSLSTVLVYHHHHHNHIVLAARISLTLSRHSSLSFIALGRSSGQQPVSSHSCWMYVRAGRPAFARPCVGIHKSTSLMSSSLLLQQCPACLVRLTWIVFVIGGRWPYSWCLVGCCCQDLFRIARSILV